VRHTRVAPAGAGKAQKLGAMNAQLRQQNPRENNRLGRNTSRAKRKSAARARASSFFFAALRGGALLLDDRHAGARLPSSLRAAANSASSRALRLGGFGGLVDRAGPWPPRPRVPHARPQTRASSARPRLVPPPAAARALPRAGAGPRRSTSVQPDVFSYCSSPGPGLLLEAVKKGFAGFGLAVEAVLNAGAFRGRSTCGSAPSLSGYRKRACRCSARRKQW